MRAGNGVYRGRFLKAVILAICVIAAQGIRAQDSTRADADVGSGRLQQLMDVMLPDSALMSMVDIVFDQLAFSFPSLSKEELGKIRDRFDPASLKDQLYAIYRRNYSQEEAAELLEFYASPLGRKVAATDMAVWRASWIEAQSLARRMIEKTIAGKAQPNVRWTAFVPEDGTFTVLLPGEPSEMTIPTELPSGMVEMRQYMTTSSYCAYIVAVADSALNGDATSVDAVLESMSDTVIKRVGGEVVSDVPFVRADGSGREITIMPADGDGVYRVRLFVGGERLYQLTVVTPISEYYTSQAVHFLDSFELISQ